MKWNFKNTFKKINSFHWNDDGGTELFIPFTSGRIFTQHELDDIIQQAINRRLGLDVEEVLNEQPNGLLRRLYNWITK